MPPVEELKNPNDKFATIIYTDDGQEMGRYYRNSGNRVYADYDEISPYIIDALIATEDARFEDHSGIDMRAMARVLVKTLILHQKMRVAVPPSRSSLQNSSIRPTRRVCSTALSRSLSNG